MQDQIVAALAGSVIAALRVVRKGWIKVLQAFISGFFLSFYVSPDVVEALNANFGIMISYSAVYFIFALFGSEISDRVINIIRTSKVSSRWS